MKIEQLDVAVIDTPSLTEKKNLLNEMLNKYGNYLIAVIVPLDRQYSESVECFRIVKKFLINETKFKNQIMVIFTKDDTLNAKNSLADFKRSCPPDVKTILDMSKERNISVDTNKFEKRKDILPKIKQWIDEMRGKE